MENKRGQGLSTNAIILIVLGVVVLVVLILGFTIGWNRILPFVDSNNVETIKTSCSIACSTNNVFDFCTQQRDLKAGDDEVTATCFEFADPDGEYTQFGIGQCPSIECGSSEGS